MLRSVGFLVGVLAAIVMLSGFGLWVAEFVRDRPVDQPRLKYYFSTKYPDNFEWQLYAVGAGLMLTAPIALGFGALYFLIAIPLYGWAYRHLRRHPHGLGNEQTAGHAQGDPELSEDWDEVETKLGAAVRRLLPVWILLAAALFAVTLHLTGVNWHLTIITFLVFWVPSTLIIYGPAIWNRRRPDT